MEMKVRELRKIVASINRSCNSFRITIFPKNDNERCAFHAIKFYGSAPVESTGKPDGNNSSDLRLSSNRIPEPKTTRIRRFFKSLAGLVSSEHAMKLHEHVDELHRLLGPIYRDRVGPVTAIFVNSPDDFRNIFRLEGPTPMHFLPEAWSLYNKTRDTPRGLLFMDGDEWLHFRRKMNRAMLVPDPSLTMVRPCEEAAHDLVEGWKCFADTQEPIPDLETKLYQWSIEVTLATLTGSAWKKYKSHIEEEIENLARILHRIFALSAKLSLLPANYAMKFRLPVWREFCTVADQALSIVRSLVPEMARLEGDGLLAVMKKEGIEDEKDLIRIVTDLVIAAGDTTAFSTQWSLFLLAQHSNIQDKLCERIRSLDEGRIVADAYVKSIIRESLRLYPTAPFLTRFMPDDGIIAGYHISKGELIIMSIYSSGRDERNFPKPNEFRPERWMRNEKGFYTEVLNPHGSLPFALGARSCIGRKLAETQMALTLSKIAKNFRIECTNAEHVNMILHLISVPSQPIKLTLSKR